MAVLQVLYKGKKDKDWLVMGDDTSVIDKATVIRLQVRVNGFGMMRVTKPVLYNLVTSYMENQEYIPFDVAEFEPAGWLTFAELPKANIVKGDVLKVVNMVNKGTINELNNSLFCGCKNDQADVHPFEGRHLPCAGLDFSGHNIKFHKTEVFRLCTFDRAHLTGDLYRVHFAGCRMHYVSLKDAVLWQGNSHVSMHRCSYYGMKYGVCGVGISDLDNQLEVTYDVAKPKIDPYNPINIVANDALFKGVKACEFKGGQDGGYNIVTADKPVLVSKFDGLPDKPYEPVPGKVLAKHMAGEGPGTELPDGKTWYNFRPISKDKLVTCAVTGWKVHRDYTSQARVGEDVVGALGLSANAGELQAGLAAPSYYPLTTLSGILGYSSETIAACRTSRIFFTIANLREHGHSFYHHTLVPRERIGGHRSTHGEMQFYVAEHEDPSNITDKLFFGFELEVEMQDKKDKIMKLEKVSDVQKQLIIHQDQRAFNEVVDQIRADKFWHTKSDGSLQFGYEIVSQPFSWGWWNTHRDGRIANLLTMLREGGYVSHDSGRAGLHVHMSRQGFKTSKIKGTGGSTFTGSLHLWRFSRMIYGNPQFSIYMSRRHDKNPRYAQIEPKKFNNSVVREVVSHSTGVADRYSALNYCNKHTVEVRMFRGTLNFKSFCASLEFCHAMWAYTATPTNPLDIRQFIKWVNTSYSFDAKGGKISLYPYLSGLFKSKMEKDEKGNPGELEQVLSNKWVHANEGWEQKLPPQMVKMGVKIGEKA